MTRTRRVVGASCALVGAAVLAATLATSAGPGAAPGAAGRTPDAIAGAGSAPSGATAVLMADLEAAGSTSSSVPSQPPNDVVSNPTPWRGASSSSTGSCRTRSWWSV
jgi:hypothetical protein